MPRKTGSVRLPDVGVIPGAADGDPSDPVTLTQLAHQLVAAPIWEGEVADEAVESLRCKGRPRLRAGARGDNGVASAAQQFGHDDGGGFVIFDHEQGKPDGFGGGSGFGHEGREATARMFGKSKVREPVASAYATTRTLDRRWARRTRPLGGKSVIAGRVSRLLWLAEETARTRTLSVRLEREWGDC